MRSARVRTAGILGVCVIASELLGAREAHAYIDPGTGSYLVQAAVAALMGGLVALKTYWHKVKTFFSRGGEADPTEPEEK